MVSGVIFLLGIWELISPWVLGYTDLTNATLNAVIVGILIAIFAIGRFAGAYYASYLSWFNVACGIWLIVSPWIIGYTFAGGVLINSVAVGAVVVILAWASATMVHRRPV